MLSFMTFYANFVHPPLSHVFCYHLPSPPPHSHHTHAHTYLTLCSYVLLRSDSGTEEGYIEALLCFTDVDENGYVDFEEFSVMYRKFKERLSRRVEKNNRVAMRKGGKEVSSLADLRRNGGATGRSERKKPQSGMSYDVKEVPETMKSWTSRKAAERALKKPKINKKEVLFWKSIFDEYDVDKNGSLTMQEMSEKMEEDPTFASIDVTTVFKSVDKDRSGAITFSELLRMMYPYTSKARLTEMLKFVAQQVSGDVALW
mmetsp:Transcript_10781/g.28267  ORF Transcript_10781/g.28267 Transcript_10781/m.28267 type:complete len:258 (-) Transcript_10781:1240-2013(-)